MDLRDLIFSPEAAGSLATITAVASDGTVSLDMGGGRIVDSCSVIGSYVPESGRPVVVLRLQESATYLVLGEVRTSNTTPVTSVSLAFPYNVVPAAPTTANPLTVNAIASASWRDFDGWAWRPSNAMQGAYSAGYGYYRGLYFYGAGAFADLSGARCTRARIKLHRDSGVGNSAATPMMLALHAHQTRPGGAPTFTTAATMVGSLAWSSAATFDLPISWGQALIDGRAAGVGHLRLDRATYSQMASLAADSTSGRLLLDWA